MNYKDAIIETNRLVIRSLDENNVSDLVEILTDNEIKKTYMLPDLKTDEEIEKMVKRLFSLSFSNEHFFFGIYLGNKLIGFMNDVAFDDGDIEVGYVINSKYKNNGYCSEALKGLISYLFSKEVKAVTAGAFEGNNASFKVMEKAGMSKIDKVDSIEYRGATHKCYYYRIIKK